MNQKNARIRKLWERGVRDPAKIARKLGFQPETGVARVLEGLKAEGLLTQKDS